MSTSDLKNFLEKFKFDPKKKLFIGIEREGFLIDDNNNIIPFSPIVLVRLTDRSRFGYELSACQLEDRIGPCKLEDLEKQLFENERQIAEAEKELNFGRIYIEVAPNDIPLDVFPDPTGRYQKITKNMPREILLAACRVAAIHVHVGMPDCFTALKVYNEVIRHTNELCVAGDGSCGERLRIYKMMAPDFQPPYYDDWQHFYKTAVEKGFAEDPRKCWNLIRISAHGTIEFRMFGSTSDFKKIINWAKTCHGLCRNAMDR